MSGEAIASICVGVAGIIATALAAAIIIHKQGWKLDKAFYRGQILGNLIAFPFGMFIFAREYWPNVKALLIIGFSYVFIAIFSQILIRIFLKPSGHAQQLSARSSISTAVWNEQTKLLANALDRAGTACFTVGVATPLAGYLYKVTDVTVRVAPAELALLVGSWLSACAIFHALARRVLGGLKG